VTDTTCTVMSIPNTEQGLHSIVQLQPDVILLDVMMPGMDGWELLQRLRTRSETSMIPVVICSVIKDPELAFAMGASRYILKPVTREMFLTMLQELQILRP
jgi:CheY-like chemotaxis protein